MLNSINRICFTSQINNNKQDQRQTYSSKLTYLTKDTVSFKGMSLPSAYNSVFSYLAAKTLHKKPNYGIAGNFLSSHNIEDCVKRMFGENKVYNSFNSYIKSDHQKIKWKAYVPDTVRIPEVERINSARTARLDEWKSFLENPANFEGSEQYKSLVKDVDAEPSLKFVIWDAINQELKENNRHIPVPFNLHALSETIAGFKSILAKERAVRCESPSFIDIYTHRLRDNLLMDMELSQNDKVWVKIPSLKHDRLNNKENIKHVEILSNKNWCTRSAVDKAEEVLKDGDFHVYLERDKNNLWQPQVGMAKYNGEVDQIQGPLNDNIIPTQYLKTVKAYLKDNKLSCRCEIADEGPKAFQQIFISGKLAETRPELSKSFEKALKENDGYSIFKYLDMSVERLDNGKLKINSYKPSHIINPQKGITVPYGMLGINEQTLLDEVEIIDGDMILSVNNYKPWLSSQIEKFPSSLKKVKGKIVCTAEQYDKFKEDFERVSNGNIKIIN